MEPMTSYYGRLKSGFSSIDPVDATQLTEDWMVAGVTGGILGLLSGALGGLDHKIAGFTIPVDGLASLGLGYVGLQAGGDTGKVLKLASIAAAGSASTRTFEKFFKGAFHVKGEFEDLGSGAMGISGHRFHGQLPPYGPGAGFGVGAQDRLVEAAKYL
jgi:hypothetical protein